MQATINGIKGRWVRTEGMAFEEGRWICTDFPTLPVTGTLTSKPKNFRHVFLPNPQDVIKFAYEMADDMMEARK